MIAPECVSMHEGWLGHGFGLSTGNQPILQKIDNYFWQDDIYFSPNRQNPPAALYEKEQSRLTITLLYTFK